MALVVFIGCALGVVGCGGRWRAMAAVFACAGAIAASCGWRSAALESSPLRELAEARAEVTMAAVVLTEPRRYERFGSSSVLVRVDASRTTAAGDVTVSGHAPVLAIVRNDSALLSVGRPLTLGGRMRPADGASEVATVDVQRLDAQQQSDWWWRGADRIRAGVRNAVRHGPADARALVPALVDGDDARLSDQVQEEFRRAGLTHLLAVSGTNLTIVLVLVLGLARTVGIRRRWLVLVGAVAVLGFVLVARPDPSVLRAAAMGSIGLVATIVGGRGGVKVLASAVLVLLFLDPWLARAPGFVLSVSATAGIVLGARPLAAGFARWMPRWCALALAVPLAAQVACLPALVVLSGQISVVGLAANLVAAPLVAPTTIGGLAGGLLDLVSREAAQIPGFAATLCAALIVDIAHASANLAGAVVPWRAPLWVLAAVFPVLVIGLWRASNHPAVICGLVLGLGIAVVRPPQLGWPPPQWLMVACDVGQGDATVINVGRGSAVLVDAGPEPYAVNQCLRRLRVRALPLIVITHDHADHDGGWAGVTKGRLVGVVLRGPSGGPGRLVVAGDRFRVGRVLVDVLWPPASAATPSADDGTGMNNASVVVRATMGDLRILLAGDVETEAQTSILASGVDVRADVLKFPHHGSGRQSPEFLAAVDATVATISVGADNDYGHPADSALQLLRGRGTDWRRTDRDGDIALVVRDGRILVVTRH